MEKATIGIGGMSCAHCAARVQKALEALGCRTEVSLTDKRAVISADRLPSDADIRAAVEGNGFAVTNVERG